MRALAGFLLGFMLMPVTIGLIGLFAFLGIHFDLRRSDTAVGSITGIAVLLLAVAVAIGRLR